MRKEVVRLRLEVRNKARDLVQAVYKATQRLPVEVREKLGNEMRKEAIHVSTFLIEGSARMSLDEQTEYFLTAYGSLNKISNYVILAGRHNLIHPETAHEIKLLLTEVADTLNKLVEEQQKGKKND